MPWLECPLLDFPKLTVCVCRQQVISCTCESCEPQFGCTMSSRDRIYSAVDAWPALGFQDPCFRTWSLVQIACGWTKSTLHQVRWMKLWDKPRANWRTWSHPPNKQVIAIHPGPIYACLPALFSAPFGSDSGPMFDPRNGS